MRPPVCMNHVDIMVKHVAEAMQVDVCSIPHLLDERNQRYLLMASERPECRICRPCVFADRRGLVGLVGQREEIVNLEQCP